MSHLINNEVQGMNGSYWFNTYQENSAFAHLEGTKKTEVLIIGGGFTGLSAALHLSQKGISNILLEKSMIGSGASGRNVGYVNAGLWLEPEVVEKRAGDYGKLLLSELSDAPNLVFDLINNNSIDCDLSKIPVIKLAHNSSSINSLKNHIKQWGVRGVNSIELLSKNQVEEICGTNNYLSGIIDHRSRTINPLKYAKGLAIAANRAGTNIYENSEAISVEKENNLFRVSTNKGAVYSKYIIAATDAYSSNLFPSISENLIPIGCFCYVSEELTSDVFAQILPKSSGIYDTRNVMLFARRIAGNRILVGSLGHLPKGDPNLENSFANRLFRKIFGYNANFNWEKSWDGTISYTTDNLPRFIELEPNVISIFGYNGRGIAPGTYFGKCLAEYISGSNFQIPLPKNSSKPVFMKSARSSFYETCFNLSRLFI